MKKILGLLTLTLTLLFGFSTENINAQNDYNKTDNHGRRQGKWIDFHDNGKTFVHIYYDYGKTICFVVGSMFGPYSYVCMCWRANSCAYPKNFC